MGTVDRVDAFQRRHPRAGFPIAVLYKFFDDQGAYLAALITYYGVVSLLPLLLLLSTILDFVLAGDPGLQHDLLNSALGQFPVVGDRLSDPNGVQGSGAGLVIGIVGTVYGGLGVGQALQNAMNTVWRVPRNERPNPFKSRARSVVIISIVGLSVAATTGLSALTTSSQQFGAPVSRGLGYLLLAASLVINAAIFTLAFRVATARALPVRTVWRGAVIAAVAWQALQAFGTALVGHEVARATELNGLFAIVLGLIAWIYVEALIVVFAAEYNAVRALKLYPRALLTPFTDNVSLTKADEAAYRSQAIAQRSKGFQDIDVTFEPHARHHDDE